MLVEMLLLLTENTTLLSTVQEDVTDGLKARQIELIDESILNGNLGVR